MARALQFTAGILLLLALEIYRVYFIMPFPGSQDSGTVDLAYFLHTNLFWFRTIGLLLILFPAWHYYRFGKLWAKLLVSLALVLVVVIVYLFNFKFVADKMFYQPEHLTFGSASTNVIPHGDLVVGVHINGESKAYPIELIGYHHQVRDTVGGEPVMVTYCTVCRTGRVFSPVVDGKAETFRLVGMDHFNAMFEDASTGSWWRQATGEAIVGPQKGKQLKELSAEQMTLWSWQAMHPNTKVMQPDSVFAEQYTGMRNYDEGKSKSDLTRRDSLSWREKSWVIGVVIGKHSRAYDWNDLLASRVVNDTLAATPIVVAIGADSASFHVWKRDTLQFTYDKALNRLKDQTGTHWNWQGQCEYSSLKVRQLPSVQSYQEFWHSWRTFHPGTSKHNAPK